MASLTDETRFNRETGRKEIYYAVQWWEGPKKRKKGLGFVPKREANQMLKIIEGKLARGEPVDPPPTASGSAERTAPERSKPTLAEYLDAVYVPTVQRDKAPKTFSSARTSANALKSILGGRRLDEIDFAGIDDYVTKRRALGRRAKTVIIELAWLRLALTHARDSGIIPALPTFPKIKNRKRDRKPHRYLSPEQCLEVLEALRPLEVQPHKVTRGKPPIPRDRLTYVAVLVAINLGLRKQEILTRGFEDVLWDQGPYGTLLVCPKPEIGFQMKTGHDRAVPLTPVVRAELERLHTERGKPREGWIFPSPRDETRPRQDFGIALRRACRRAGIPVIHPHGLRHAWATRLAMSGTDRRSLMELGGWQEGRMLDEIYAHTTSSVKAEIMAKSGLGRTSKPRDDNSPLTDPEQT